MNTITIHGHVDAQHCLSVQVPESIPPGPVTIFIVPSTRDDAENAWMTGVAREWADDLSDSRQDIYTLDDGKPLDAS